MCRKSPVCVCEADGKAGVTWIVYVSDRGKRQEWNKEERRENGGRIDRLTEPQECAVVRLSPCSRARGSHQTLFTSSPYSTQPMRREREILFTQSLSLVSHQVLRERERERERDGQAFMFTHRFGRWTPSEDFMSKLAQSCSHCQLIWWDETRNKRRETLAENEREKKKGWEKIREMRWEQRKEWKEKMRCKEGKMKERRVNETRKNEKCE